MAGGKESGCLTNKILFIIDQASCLLAPELKYK
jgi:hypothetical protein